MAKKKIPSRERSHIPPNGKRKIMDSKLPFLGDMLVPSRVSFKLFSLFLVSFGYKFMLWALDECSHEKRNKNTWKSYPYQLVIVEDSSTGLLIIITHTTN